MGHHKIIILWCSTGIINLSESTGKSIIKIANRIIVRTKYKWSNVFKCYGVFELMELQCDHLHIRHKVCVAVGVRQYKTISNSKTFLKIYSVSVSCLFRSFISVLLWFPSHWCGLHQVMFLWILHPVPEHAHNVCGRIRPWGGRHTNSCGLGCLMWRRTWLLLLSPSKEQAAAWGLSHEECCSSWLTNALGVRAHWTRYFHHQG
jgi:hypothetical protein